MYQMDQVGKRGAHNSFLGEKGEKKNSYPIYYTHTIHAWYIYLHLVVLSGKIW